MQHAMFSIKCKASDLLAVYRLISTLTKKHVKVTRTYTHHHSEEKCEVLIKFCICTGTEKSVLTETFKKWACK